MSHDEFCRRTNETASLAEQPSREQLEDALRDFFAACCRASAEFNIVQPFVGLAAKHASVLRSIGS